MEIHEYDTTINDLQFSLDRTYFITAGKDKSAKVVKSTVPPQVVHG
jgi:translation initiation factor 3 subunit I